MKKTREQKGITLVALIITIIVLIILAVISIPGLTGESSIIRQAIEAKAQSEIGEEKQGNTLNQIESVLIGKDSTDSGNEYEGIAEPISMFGGAYEMGTESNNTYIDIRPNEERDYVYVFSDATFTNYVKKQSTTATRNGTNRVDDVIKLVPMQGDINIKFVFKNCTFNNCSVEFSGLSGVYTNLDITFENCTFNALTNQKVLNFSPKGTGTVNITNCTFNMECTSSFHVIDVSNFSDTTLVINASNNTLNATIATPYTYDASKGETIKDNVYVSSYTPKNICLFDYRYFSSGYSQVNEIGTILKGDIAIESPK